MPTTCCSASRYVPLEHNDNAKPANIFQDRNAYSSTPDSEVGDSDTPASNMAKDYDNEQLQNFFSGLMNRK